MSVSGSRPLATPSAGTAGGWGSSRAGACEAATTKTFGTKTSGPVSRVARPSDTETAMLFMYGGVRRSSAGALIKSYRRLRGRHGAACRSSAPRPPPSCTDAHRRPPGQLRRRVAATGPGRRQAGVAVLGGARSVTVRIGDTRRDLAAELAVEVA